MVEGLLCEGKIPLFASIELALAFTLMPHTEVDCERCPILDHVCPLDNQSVVRGACTSSCPRFWWPLLCWSFCSMTSTSVQVNKDGLYFHSVHLWFRIYLSTFVWKLNGKLWVRMDKWWIVFSYPNKCFLPLFWHLTGLHAKFSVSKVHIRKCWCRSEFNTSG